MADQIDAKIGDLTVRIQRDACIGSGNCAKVAPELFELDADTIVAFIESTDTVDRDRLLESCRVCPVLALTVLDADGNQLVP